MKYFATYNFLFESTLFQVEKIIDETQTPTGAAAIYSNPIVECPAHVQAGWYYNEDTGTFISPEEYERDKELYKVKVEFPELPELPEGYNLGEAHKK